MLYEVITDRLLVLPFIQNDPCEHPRQQQLMRVGKEGAQGHRASARVDGHFGEFQRPRLVISATVLQNQFGLGLLRSYNFV